MNTNEELNAEVAIEKSVPTKKKRKAQRDPDASKKKDDPKRRRKASGFPSSADVVALNQDQQLNGQTSPSLDLNKVENSTKDDAISKASRLARKTNGRKAREPNSSPAAASHSIDLQKGNVSTKKAASDSKYDSEDEAPETVSAAAGLLQSRRAAADVAKVEEMKKAAGKSKRREHDARLKTQAKSAKERTLIDQASAEKGPKPETTSKDTNAGTHDASVVAKWSIGDPLPEFLPDEILAAVPEIPSAPVPSEPQSRQTPVKGKLRTFQTNSNCRKRLKQGSTVYQVLDDDDKGNLPPKVATRSMQLRELWLRGRKDPRGEDIVRRRKAGGGFVRNQWAKRRLGDSKELKSSIH